MLEKVGISVLMLKCMAVLYIINFGYTQNLSPQRLLQLTRSGHRTTSNRALPLRLRVTGSKHGTNVATVINSNVNSNNNNVQQSVVLGGSARTGQGSSASNTRGSLRSSSGSTARSRNIGINSLGQLSIPVLRITSNASPRISATNALPRTASLRLNPQPRNTQTSTALLTQRILALARQNRLRQALARRQGNVRVNGRNINIKVLNSLLKKPLRISGTRRGSLSGKRPESIILTSRNSRRQPSVAPSTGIHSSGSNNVNTATNSNKNTASNNRHIKQTIVFANLANILSPVGTQHNRVRLPNHNPANGSIRKPVTGSKVTSGRPRTQSSVPRQVNQIQSNTILVHNAKNNIVSQSRTQQQQNVANNLQRNQIQANPIQQQASTVNKQNTAINNLNTQALSAVQRKSKISQSSLKSSVGTSKRGNLPKKSTVGQTALNGLFKSNLININVGNNGFNGNKNVNSQIKSTVGQNTQPGARQGQTIGANQFNNALNKPQNRASMLNGQRVNLVDIPLSRIVGSAPTTPIQGQQTNQRQQPTQSQQTNQRQQTLKSVIQQLRQLQSQVHRNLPSRQAQPTNSNTNNLRAITSLHGTFRNNLQNINVGNNGLNGNRNINAQVRTVSGQSPVLTQTQKHASSPQTGTQQSQPAVLQPLLQQRHQQQSQPGALQPSLQQQGHLPQKKGHRIPLQSNAPLRQAQPVISGTNDLNAITTLLGTLINNLHNINHGNNGFNGNTNLNTQVESISGRSPLQTQIQPSQQQTKTRQQSPLIQQGLPAPQARQHQLQPRVSRPSLEQQGPLTQQQQPQQVLSQQQPQQGMSQHQQPHQGVSKQQPQQGLSQQQPQQSSSQHQQPHQGVSQQQPQQGVSIQQPQQGLSQQQPQQSSSQHQQPQQGLSQQQLQQGASQKQQPQQEMSPQQSVSQHQQPQQGLSKQQPQQGVPQHQQPQQGLSQQEVSQHQQPQQGLSQQQPQPLSHQQNQQVLQQGLSQQQQQPQQGVSQQQQQEQPQQGVSQQQQPQQGVSQPQPQTGVHKPSLQQQNHQTLQQGVSQQQQPQQGVSQPQLQTGVHNPSLQQQNHQALQQGVSQQQQQQQQPQQAVSQQQQPPQQGVSQPQLQTGVHKPSLQQQNNQALQQGLSQQQQQQQQQQKQQQQQQKPQQGVSQQQPQQGVSQKQLQTGGPQPSFKQQGHLAPQQGVFQQSLQQAQQQTQPASAKRPNQQLPSSSQPQKIVNSQTNPKSSHAHRSVNGQNSLIGPGQSSATNSKFTPRQLMNLGQTILNNNLNQHVNTISNGSPGQTPNIPLGTQPQQVNKITNGIPGQTPNNPVGTQPQQVNKITNGSPGQTPNIPLGIQPQQINTITNRIPGQAPNNHLGTQPPVSRSGHLSKVPNIQGVPKISPIGSLQKSSLHLQNSFSGSQLQPIRHINTGNQASINQRRNGNAQRNAGVSKFSPLRTSGTRSANVVGGTNVAPQGLSSPTNTPNAVISHPIKQQQLQQKALVNQPLGQQQQQQNPGGNLEFVSNLNNDPLFHLATGFNSLLGRPGDNARLNGIFHGGSSLHISDPAGQQSTTLLAGVGPNSLTGIIQSDVKSMQRTAPQNNGGNMINQVLPTKFGNANTLKFPVGSRQMNNPNLSAPVTGSGNTAKTFSNPFNLNNPNNIANYIEQISSSNMKTATSTKQIPATGSKSATNQNQVAGSKSTTNEIQAAGSKSSGTTPSGQLNSGTTGTPQNVNTLTLSGRGKTAPITLQSTGNIRVREVINPDGTWHYVVDTAQGSNEQHIAVSGIISETGTPVAQPTTTTVAPTSTVATTPTTTMDPEIALEAQEEAAAAAAAAA